ncbi:nuclear transport factor 2 family protein [Bradyrhizobium sp.]|uniref:nuclear transport factor 2 family protein n=1 Tax=Bradyrhizobium sp. TaxID=376 RepID=UPI00239A9FFD|nr:nuclear transport factor 2 family protein [Bradyrhizobium sp.]MDE2375845.1 nuclear transport factor 2 family protein [Bradyrhizobium sp.]
MSDFDSMGIVVDWLDACRKGDLQSLLDLYADDAELECECDGTRLYRGRSGLADYWGPRLGGFSSAGFGLEELSPAPHGVELEYSIAGSLRIRAIFGFNADGKIFQTRCTPGRQNPGDCCTC